MCCVAQEAADWSRESRFSAFRMRHPDGNAQLLAMIGRHFRVPPANCTPSAVAPCEQRHLFESYLYLTQLQQARCYETAFSHWRRGRSSAAHTMGILYWQLNAIWQGPDWSTIEYDGRLRLAHHASRRAFAPLLLSGVRDAVARDDESHVLDIHLSNDLPRRVEGTLRVRLYRWRDAPAYPLAELETRAAIPPASSHMVWRVDLMQMMLLQTPQRVALPPSAVFARLTFVPAEPEAEAVEAFHWLAPFKEVELPAAQPRILHVAQVSPTAAAISLASNATAAFVTVECATVIGAFSDAAFLLLAGDAPTTVTFEAQAPFALDAFAAALRVRSLSDTVVSVARWQLC